MIASILGFDLFGPSVPDQLAPIAQAMAAQQATASLSFYEWLRPARPAEKPLDERYNEFKAKLEAMLDKHPSARLA